MSTSLSAVIIAKNSANLLPDCLASINWVDEIILLDSGSEDNTIGIAIAAGVKVFVNTDWQGYGIQRQRAQLYATGDYILMIDTDERLTPNLQKAIQKILASLPKNGVVYSIDRRNYFLGRFMRHSGWSPDRVLRLYSQNYKYNDNIVHESLSIGDARIIHLQGDLVHLTCSDFINFQQKQLNHAIAWAQEYHQFGKKTSITIIIIHTIGTFLKTLLVRGGIFDGKQGWLLSVVNAHYTFNKYTELWALNYGFSKKRMR